MTLKAPHTNFGIVSQMELGSSVVDLEMKGCKMSIEVLGKVDNVAFIVGESSGKIRNCKSIDNTFNFVKGNFYNVGGVVGYSNGFVESCSTIKLNAKKQSSVTKIQYFGGNVGRLHCKSKKK